MLWQNEIKGIVEPGQPRRGNRQSCRSRGNPRETSKIKAKLAPSLAKPAKGLVLLLLKVKAWPFGGFLVARGSPWRVI
jgi:hypothetical protein